LEVFWRSHNPARRAGSQQYKAALFVHDVRQRELAEASKAALAAQKSAAIQTEILPASTFYLAEDYHQKYYLQHAPRLWAEIVKIYPEPAGWINSTAAARLNGYVGRCGTAAALAAEIESFGLSPAAQAELRQLAGR